MTLADETTRVILLFLLTAARVLRRLVFFVEQQHVLEEDVAVGGRHLSDAAAAHLAVLVAGHIHAMSPFSFHGAHLSPLCRCASRKPCKHGVDGHFYKE